MAGLQNTEGEKRFYEMTSGNYLFQLENYDSCGMMWRFMAQAFLWNVIYKNYQKWIHVEANIYLSLFQ